MSAWLSGPTMRNSPQTVNNHRASMSYVTGSHNVKVGYGWVEQYTSFSQVNDGDWTTYTTLRGLPFQATFWGSANSTDEANPTLGIFAQDRWTVDRLTVNAGIRWDYIKASYPDQSRPTNVWVREPFLIEGMNVVTWKDFQPRLGVAYDLRGDGKTALKFSAGRYGKRDATAWARLVNPSTSNRRMARSWFDGATGHPFLGIPAGTFPSCIGPVVCIPGDGIVQGDPLNPAPNGELVSPSVAPAFGRPAITNFYDPDWAFGWGKRLTNWEVAASIQQELLRGVS